MIKFFEIIALSRFLPYNSIFDIFMIVLDIYLKNYFLICGRTLCIPPRGNFPLRGDSVFMLFIFSK